VKSRHSRAEQGGNETGGKMLARCGVDRAKAKTDWPLDQVDPLSMLSAGSQQSYRKVTVKLCVGVGDGRGSLLQWR
jgi:hypothetical protein